MLYIPDRTRQRLCTEAHHHDTMRDQICRMLKQAGLRSTRQRIELGKLLLSSGHRHVTVDELHNEALAAGISHSLATIYNTLNQFVAVGLLRCINLDGTRSFFDTNESEHHHFYVEEKNEVIDIPAEDVSFARLPAPPDGYKIASVDVVIRLERVDGEADTKAPHGRMPEDPAERVRYLDRQN